MEQSRDIGDIGQMMRAYAEDAVSLARQHDIHLDYSERSLEEVERLLADFDDEMDSGSTSGSQRAERLDEMSRTWGGYLGEVVRRRFGGEWTIEKYPGGDFLIVTLNVNGARLFPAMKVHRRLTEGDSENLWTFYQSVKANLEEKAGA